MIDPDQEPTIRLIIFVGVLAGLALLELLIPRRKLVGVKWQRWITNLGLIVIDTLALRLLFPLLAVGFAGYVASKGWGLFNLLNLPVALEIILCVFALDLAIYFQHVISHKIGIFWALHKVHHVDRDVDVTTAIRFHPIEIVLSMVYKFAIIIVLGPAALAVFLFEVLLNASAMFTHANLTLPAPLDYVVRLLFVTPDMHRVHHSVHHNETDSNYGFNLSIWDRMFGTYIPQPKDGHEDMTLGQNAYQTDEPSKLWFCLLLPFLPKRPQELRAVEHKKNSGK